MPAHATPIGSFGATRGNQQPLPAIVTTARGLAQLLDAYYPTFDRETSDLMSALAAWVEKNVSNRV